MKIKALFISAIFAVSLLSITAANAVTATYTYDELNRLTQVNYDDGTVIKYVYDEIGNRLSTSCIGTCASQTISAVTGRGGSIIPRSATVNYGESQTFTITPSTGYYITDVKVDGVSKGAITSYTFFANVTAPHTISASFAIYTYPITVTQGSGGVITPGTTYVNYGSNQTFTITPNNGNYSFDVKVDNVSKGAITSQTFSNVTAAHSISATFTCLVQPVRRMPANIYYSSLATAYAAAVDGDTIQMRNITFLEGATITKSIILDGGYECGFTNKNGLTTLKGSQVRISNGVINMKNIFVSK